MMPLFLLLPALLRNYDMIYKLTGRHIEWRAWKKEIKQ